MHLQLGPAEVGGVSLSLGDCLQVRCWEAVSPGVWSPDSVSVVWHLTGEGVGCYTALCVMMLQRHSCSLPLILSSCSTQGVSSLFGEMCCQQVNLYSQLTSAAQSRPL